MDQHYLSVLVVLKTFGVVDTKGQGGKCCAPKPQCDSQSGGWESLYLKMHQYYCWGYTQRMLNLTEETLVHMCFDSLSIISRNWK